MHFKISQEQMKNLVNFVAENLVTKHGHPILTLLNSLPQVEEQQQQHIPEAVNEEEHQAAEEAA